MQRIVTRILNIFTARYFWDKVFEFLALRNMSSNKAVETIYAKMSQLAKSCVSTRKKNAVYFFKKEGRHVKYASNQLFFLHHKGTVDRYGLKNVKLRFFHLISRTSIITLKMESFGEVYVVQAGFAYHLSRTLVNGNFSIIYCVSLDLTRMHQMV